MPQRQPKRGRLWLNDGSCIRLRPEYPGHVWAYDFVEGRAHDGRRFRIPTIIDEANRECLALIVARQLKHEDVLAALADLFIARGALAHIRSDNVLCREERRILASRYLCADNHRRGMHSEPDGSHRQRDRSLP